MDRKREGNDPDGYPPWFNTKPSPEEDGCRPDTGNPFPENLFPSETPPPHPPPNQMYNNWDHMYNNLVLQNPSPPMLQNPSPMLQNPPQYHQNANPNFDQHFFTRNSSNNPINPNNGFSNGSSTFGYGSGGGKGTTHGYFGAADQTLHPDHLGVLLNRLSLSNNGSSGLPPNMRRPNSFMPNSTILGGNAAFSAVEQQYLERLHQLYIQSVADQYRRALHQATTQWISSSCTAQSLSVDQFGNGNNGMPGITQMNGFRLNPNPSLGSFRNGFNRRFSNGAGRLQQFGQEEGGQGNHSFPKDQRLGNGSARHAHISTYSVPLEELTGKIAVVAADQHGSRFLQKKIEEGKREEVDMILNEVLKKGHEDLFRGLMKNQYGTEVIQKLVEGTNREGWARMLDLVMSDERKLRDICADQHGSRAMQKLLERVEPREQQSSFMRILKRITIPLSKTQPGYYVIQVCLKNFYPDCTKGVLELMIDNCPALAKDKFGCCLLQNSLQYVYTEVKERIVAAIIEHARILSEDPYGNYVVQYIIGLRIPSVTADLLGELQGYFVKLSMNKHGSNVVERCLKESGDENANMIVSEIMNSPDFLNVVQNNFGNYVAQSALAASKGAVHNALVNLIRSHSPHLHSHPHGKRVFEKARGGRHRF